jgi:hypothetical protein
MRDVKPMQNEVVDSVKKASWIRKAVENTSSISKKITLTSGK